MKVIYRIQNLKTGDFYIGSAIKYDYRKWHHQHMLRQNKHHNPILQNSWNKHGENAFIFGVIEEIDDPNNLVKREQHYIDSMNPRYNICKVAGSALGVKHSYEARLHMSLAHKGKKLSPESIAKRTASVLGIKRSQQTKDKMSKGSKKIPICQFNLDGSFVRDWDGSAIAARELSIVQSNITQCCKKKRKTYKGFIWKYKN